MKQPNPKAHFYISLVKSILRILAGAALLKLCLLGAGVLIILAELLGILEELF
jgi:hypothetical protein